MQWTLLGFVATVAVVWVPGGVLGGGGGGEGLTGAPMGAYDLRAGAAMIIAGLAAQGTSEVSNVQHVERGYEDIIAKLSGLGADISAVEVPDPAGQVSAAG